MITFSEGLSSENIAVWYRDIPIAPEDLKSLKGRISKECFKYLMGKTCERERGRRKDDECVHDVYSRLGKVFGYVELSLKRLVNYAQAIDRIQRIMPDIASDILEGKIQISLKDTIILAKMETSEIRTIIKRLTLEQTPITVIFNEQADRRMKPARGSGRKPSEPPKASVKDVPPYDPDAQANALTYTIPSWVSAVVRVFKNTEFCKISPDARNKLAAEMIKLKAAANTMISTLTGEE